MTVWYEREGILRSKKGRLQNAPPRELRTRRPRATGNLQAKALDGSHI